MFEITRELVAYYSSHFGIPEHLGAKFVPYMTVRQLKRNEVLFHPGQVCKEGYAVLQGGLILAHVDPQTQEEKVVSFFLRTMQPFCTVTDSYFTGKRTQCKLFAFKRTVVVSVKKEDMERILEADPEVREHYMERLNGVLVYENNLRMKLLTLSPEQFYQFLLDEHTPIIKKIPTKYIAEFMGISREWLSKIKSRLN